MGVVAALLVAACSTTPPPGPGIPGGTTSTVPATVVPVTQEPNPSCTETEGWSTALAPNPVYASTAAVNDVRTGMHGCFDQVTIDMTLIQPVGFNVRYVDQAISDPVGEPIEVAGDATIQVIVHAWDFCYPVNHPTPAPTGKPCWRPGTVLSGKVGPAIQEIKHLGTHEGQTTFAFGVASQLKIHVEIWDDKQAGITKVILYVAHPK